MAKFELAFDGTFAAVVRVSIEADTLAEAVELAKDGMKNELQCIDLNVNFDHEGVSYVMTEASPTDEDPFDLFEVDGEAV